MHVKCILDLVCFEPHYWTEVAATPIQMHLWNLEEDSSILFQRQIMCCMAITHLEEVDRVSADGCGAVWVQTHFLIWMPQGCTEQIYRAVSLSFPRRRPQNKRRCCSSHSPWAGEGTLRVAMVSGWAVSHSGHCSSQTLCHPQHCSALCLSSRSLRFTYNAFCVGKVFTSHIYPVKLAAKHWRADKHYVLLTL